MRVQTPYFAYFECLASVTSRQKEKRQKRCASS